MALNHLKSKFEKCCMLDWYRLLIDYEKSSHVVMWMCKQLSLIFSVKR